MTVLSVRGLTVRFRMRESAPVRAVTDVSFDLAAGSASPSSGRAAAASPSSPPPSSACSPATPRPPGPPCSPGPATTPPPT
ncbi:hypothetical protein ACFQVA_01600 [Actinomadura keratinilytica]